MTSFSGVRSWVSVVCLHLDLGLLPESLGGGRRIDIQLPPPNSLVFAAMKLAMVISTQGNGVFVADFAPHGRLLREFKMMRVGWLTATRQASLCAHKLEVFATAPCATVC